ncbi:MAG: Nitrincola phage, partial [Bacteroidota bacterium]
GTLSDQEDLQDALDLKADLVDGKVPSSQLPSYVDDVIEVANYAALPVTGESGKIYITIDNNHIFRWTGSIYVEITDNTAVWGAITGTLSSQTDLVTALNLRVPYAGATGNVNLGEYGLTSGYLKLDTTPTSTPTTIGTIFWDAANRTAALIDGDGDTTLQIGQEQRILVHNNTGSTLTDGQVVYVTGSTGNLPSVSLADATSETTSAATIGVVTESIANGADGFITISGIVNGLNTLAFDEGDLLWLSTTAGAFTTTKPASPAHLVLIGYVIKKAGGNGSILVKIQNTQELSESSDVLFTSLANNDILTYESSSSLWKNKSISTILGYTPANDSNVVHKTGDETISGRKTFNSTTDIGIRSNISGNGYGIYSENSSNGISFYVANNGSGKAFSVSNTLGSFGNMYEGSYNGTSNFAVNYLGEITASKFIKSGGTTFEFLKANGDVDSNIYFKGSVTAGYLPKSLYPSSGDFTTSLIYDNGTSIGIGTTSPSAFAIVDANGQFRVSNLSVQGFYQARTSDSAGSGVYGGNSFVLRNGATSEDLNFDIFNRTSSAWYTPMIIKNTGNIGIGTTSPTKKLHVKGGNDNVLFLDNGGEQYTTQYFANNGTTKSFLVWDNTNSLFEIGTAVSADLRLLTNNAEKMRITSGGDVFIGATSAANVEKLGVTYNSQDRLGFVLNDTYTGSGVAQIAIQFRRNGSAIGSITTTTTTTSYNITSDYRLKEDFKNYSGLDLISKIKTYDYKWKKSEDRMFGVKAHELQEVVPYAVTGEKDAEEMQQVDYSKLVPILVKAIQELKAEIEILKTK